jgi:O-glycosyl hydrolase
MKKLLLDLSEPYGFQDYFMGKINTRWQVTWLHELMRKDYARFLDEIAESIAAIMVYWRDTYGIVPRYCMPFNEPLSGNRELASGSPRDIANILKCAGARLRKEGFDQVLFVMPNEETEENALATAAEVLADPQARQYVGAIGFHPYPYGSHYASVKRILADSGCGRPDPGRVEVRHRLRLLGEKYGLPVWMTEVSHPEVHPFSFDHLRGRAIHIHDELVYANASAYFAMNNIWDLATHRDHFQNDDIQSEADTVVLVNNESGEVSITGIGYAIGHFARWIKPGAVRIDAASSERLLLVTAFWDVQKQQVVTQLINNTVQDMSVQIELSGLEFTGDLSGEQSTGDRPYPSSYWQPLNPWLPESPSSFLVKVPGSSVTTLAGGAREVM